VVFQEELAQIMRHFARGDGAPPRPEQPQQPAQQLAKQQAQKVQQAQRDTSNLLAALSSPPRSGPARVMPAQSTVQLLKHIYVEASRPRQPACLLLSRRLLACCASCCGARACLAGSPI
jgi:hypothetical protein